tara:strand:- start:2716 stop:3570 length:855 start_codon:yes stop_codon:yes gene_type:complete
MIERIYIPTVRRTDKQITYDNLPDELKKKVVMVIEPNERHLYNYDCEYLEIPEKLVGTWTQLAETRLFIHKHAGNIKYCVSDDDIVIERRNAKYWTGKSNMEKSRQRANNSDILEMFSKIDTWLDEPNIGIIGLSDAGIPPQSVEYVDTVGVYCMVFIDGTMLSKIIDDIDITSIRIAEDVLFLFECLSRGINTRRVTEWIYDNKSLYQKDLQNSREVWTGMFKDGEMPPNHYQHNLHIEVMQYIQSKYPECIDIYEKNGKFKFRKKWKKAYKSRLVESQKQLL